jgi:isopentenyl phosphate kinase
MSELIFLKLGGSLITDKTRPYTPRQDKLTDLADQIAAAIETQPDMRLVLGHGSGSFGHTAAQEHNTRAGVHDESGWRGFAEVWYQASKLNRFVMDALHTAGIPALAFPPSACVTAHNGQVALWNIRPLQTALQAGLLPVIFGDVIFDDIRGGTILSTEDLMLYLARELRPNRILLAGLEAGVWIDFPSRTQLIDRITPSSFDAIRSGVGGSQAADVTGGMSSKVEQMLTLVQTIPGLQIRIFSGEESGNLRHSLDGQALGTLVSV